jgi:hypothetical protein
MFIKWNIKYHLEIKRNELSSHEKTWRKLMMHIAK